MISLGIEYSPPPTKKELREWNKWRKEMNKLMGVAPLKQEATSVKKKKRRKNIKKKRNQKDVS